MYSRFERLLFALMFALLAAGVTLVVVQAQDGGPGSSTPAAPTAGTPACVACHTEFAAEWEKGPHGQAVADPKFTAEWTKQGKPGACLVCHVTNYDPATGTWQQDGVSCEACHGPMQPGHPKTAMPVDRSPDLCARCHSDTRFGWQEWQGSTHYQRGMNCTTCHDPHSASLKTTKSMDGNARYTDASQLCVTCHKDVSMNFPYSVHQKQGVTCINCHVTHTEKQPADAHAVPDHSFKANLDSCNTCHADQMHSAAQGAQTTSSVSTAVSQPPEVQQAGLSPAPTPVSPIGYASLAGLVGLAAGMVLAPWLEKWYRKATKRPQGGEDE
ncbi:MAG TPA: cytochrome c3 family protein [Anaerolineales bacterium]|nr:cytochrome c3 family protein [Anaerolineales bacterium]